MEDDFYNDEYYEEQDEYSKGYQAARDDEPYSSFEDLEWRRGWQDATDDLRERAEVEKIREIYDKK